jgi:hypothetical protein
MRLSTRVIGIGITVFLLGSILLLMAFGLWKTESTKVPAKFTSGEFSGQSNPADIRGSYSFADIERNFSIPATVIADAFQMDTSIKSAGEYKAKDLEELYGEQQTGEIGTDSVKWFTALYLGMPYVPEETTLLPQSAIAILNGLGTIDETILHNLDAHSVTPTVQQVVVEQTHVEPLEMVIKGNTTYGDLLDWGLSRSQLEEVLGFEVKDRALKLRDDLSARSLEFSVYKTKLQSMLDSLL